MYRNFYAVETRQVDKKKRGGTRAKRYDNVSFFQQYSGNARHHLVAKTRLHQDGHFMTQSSE
ncbi:hypothetical protein EGK65_20985 [Citrobacter farmeri]|nr:hypothetical protein EGK65_20985 [Citrobacter farmeri]